MMTILKLVLFGCMLALAWSESDHDRMKRSRTVMRFNRRGSCTNDPCPSACQSAMERKQRNGKLRGLVMYQTRCTPKNDPQWCQCRCVMTPPKSGSPITDKCELETATTSSFCTRDSASFLLSISGKVTKKSVQQQCNAACNDCLYHQRDTCGHELGWGGATLESAAASKTGGSRHKRTYSYKKKPRGTRNFQCVCKFTGITDPVTFTPPPVNNMNPCTIDLPNTNEDNGFTVCQTRCQSFLTSPNPNQCDLSSIANPMFVSAVCDLDPDTFTGCRCTCTYAAGAGTTGAGAQTTTMQQMTMEPDTTMMGMQTTPDDDDDTTQMGMDTTPADDDDDTTMMGMQTTPPDGDDDTTQMGMDTTGMGMETATGTGMGTLTCNVNGSSITNFAECMAQCNQLVGGGNPQCDPSALNNPSVVSDCQIENLETFCNPCICTFTGQEPVTTPQETVTTEEPVVTVAPGANVSCEFNIPGADMTNGFSMCMDQCNAFLMASQLGDPDPTCDVSAANDPTLLRADCTIPQANGCEPCSCVFVAGNPPTTTTTTTSTTTTTTTTTTPQPSTFVPGANVTCEFPIPGADISNGFSMCSDQCNMFISMPDPSVCDLSAANDPTLTRADCDIPQANGCEPCRCQFTAGDPPTTTTTTTTEPPSTFVPGTNVTCEVPIPGADVSNGFLMCMAQCNMFITTMNDPMCDLSAANNPTLVRTDCDIPGDNGCEPCRCQFITGEAATTQEPATTTEEPATTTEEPAITLPPGSIFTCNVNSSAITNFPECSAQCNQLAVPPFNPQCDHSALNNPTLVSDCQIPNLETFCNPCTCTFTGQ